MKKALLIGWLCLPILASAQVEFSLNYVWRFLQSGDSLRQKTLTATGDILATTTNVGGNSITLKKDDAEIIMGYDGDESIIIKNTSDIILQCDNVLQLINDYTDLGHLEGHGTPTLTAGTGAGTGPTVSITGSDLSFQLSITTGTTPTGSGATVATVNFSAVFTATPRVVFSPANAAAAALSGATSPFMDGSDSSHATIKSGTTALAASTNYKWNCIATR